jgi:hypothetical protein
LFYGQGSKSVFLYGNAAAVVDEMDFPTEPPQFFADVRIFVGDAKTHIVAADGFNRRSAKKHRVPMSKSGGASVLLKLRLLETHAPAR